MNHTQKEFEFNLLENSKKLKAITKPYSFEIEDVIVKRFGADALQKVTEGKHFEADFSLGNVKEDMPKLFASNLQNVDYKKTPLDTFVAVYHFFLSYKRSAWMRQLQSEKEAGLSLLREAHQILNSIPQVNSEERN